MTRLLPITILFALGLACDGITPVEQLPDWGDPDNVLDSDEFDTGGSSVGNNGGKGGGKGNGKGGINTPPRAYAGADVWAMPGDTVTLDGGMSTDLDGDPLTYKWTLLNKPAESSASLSSHDERTTSLFVDVTGDYTVQLIVNDGIVDSAPDNVVVHVGSNNKKPEVDLKVPNSVRVGEYVYLDATGSYDPDGDPITYHWIFQARPPGSITTLQNAADYSPTPFFLADVAGSYIIVLEVSDGELSSRVQRSIIASAAQSGGTGGGSGSSSNDCLDCAASSMRVAGDTWSAGNLASSFGLLMLPIFVALWHRRRDD